MHVFLNIQTQLFSGMAMRYWTTNCALPNCALVRTKQPDMLMWRRESSQGLDLEEELQATQECWEQEKGLQGWAQQRHFNLHVPEGSGCCTRHIFINFLYFFDACMFICPSMDWLLICVRACVCARVCFQFSRHCQLLSWQRFSPSLSPCSFFLCCVKTFSFYLISVFNPCCYFPRHWIPVRSLSLCLVFSSSLPSVSDFWVLY